MTHSTSQSRGTQRTLTKELYGIELDLPFEPWKDKAPLSSKTLP